jgi:hypothetical protein
MLNKKINLRFDSSQNWESLKIFICDFSRKLKGLNSSVHIGVSRLTIVNFKTLITSN